MTPYIISGLVVGSIYAISALGLVLTYTSSRVFNFAHGALAYAIAVFYYYLTRRERLEHRGRGAVHDPDRARRCWVCSSTSRCSTAHARHPDGAAGVDRRALGRDPGADPRSCSRSPPPEIFNPEGLVSSPADPNFLKVFGTYVNENQFAVIVSAVVIAVVATLVLRFTPLGLATRMTVDHPRNAGHRRCEHRGGHRRLVDGRRDARRVRGRAARPRSSASTSTSSRSCSSGRSPRS